ncbi:MAG: flavin reductase [Pusillimonas sp.]
MEISKQDFRDSMSNFAASVNIITTDGAAGRAGITASAVCSVSESPPTVLICVNKSTRLHDILIGNKVYCINVLTVADQHLSELFAMKVTMEERFGAGTWTTLTTGAPVLVRAAASLDCCVVEEIKSDTHTIFLGEVVNCHVPETDEDALIYYRRAYRNISRSMPSMP